MTQTIQDPLNKYTMKQSLKIITNNKLTASNLKYMNVTKIKLLVFFLISLVPKVLLKSILCHYASNYHSMYCCKASTFQYL